MHPKDIRNWIAALAWGFSLAGVTACAPLQSLHTSLSQPMPPGAVSSESMAAGASSVREAPVPDSAPRPPMPVASEDMVAPGTYALRYASGPHMSEDRLLEHWHQRAELLCAPRDYVSWTRSQTNYPPPGYDGLLASLSASAFYHAEAYGVATCQD